MNRAAPAKRQRRLILIALSPARQKILLDDPEIVIEILSERRATPIPGSLEFDERWIELQKALFDFLWQYGADDERAEALTPRTGRSLCEDSAIDSARLVPADRARSIAQWVTELPSDLLARVGKLGAPSPASRNFPESLGASDGGGAAPQRSRNGRTRALPRTDLSALGPDLARLQAFYAEVLRTQHAVLSIRFRE
jgi:hypothetical protein